MGLWGPDKVGLGIERNEKGCLAGLLLRLNNNDAFLFLLVLLHLFLLLLPVVIIRNNPIVSRTTYSLSPPPSPSSLSMTTFHISWLSAIITGLLFVSSPLHSTPLPLTKRAALPLLVIASRTKCGLYSTLFNCPREDVGDCCSSKDNDDWTRIEREDYKLVKRINRQAVCVTWHIRSGRKSTWWFGGLFTTRPTHVTCKPIRKARRTWRMHQTAAERRDPLLICASVLASSLNN